VSFVLGCAHATRVLGHLALQGYTQDEQDGYNAQLNPAEGSGHGPLVDVWRAKHPDAVGQYTYYSYRFKCREKGIGTLFSVLRFRLTRRVCR
jgi:exonuclease III